MRISDGTCEQRRSFMEILELEGYILKIRKRRLNISEVDREEKALEIVTLTRYTESRISNNIPNEFR